MNMTIIRLLAFLAIFLAGPISYAQQQGHETPPAPEPPVPMEAQPVKPIEKVAPGIFKIGDILMNKKENSISFPAQVNMDKGLLEYLIVSAGGKTHESLFRTKVRPYDLQIAFLLLGFEGTDRPLAYQGAIEKPKGEPLDILIKYIDSKGNSVKIDTEEWIMQMIGDTRKDIQKLDWIFTGSVIMDGQFIAQNEGDIAAIFRDPVSLINNASKGGESDEIWFAKEGTVPPVGTTVTIIFKAIK